MNFISERTELLKITRSIIDQAMVIGTWGNVSMRIDEHRFLITPSARGYATMQPEDLILMDLSGKILAGNWKPSSENPIHAGIYQECPEVGAVLHVHCLYASMFAVTQKVIPVILEETAQVIGHPIETLPYATCGTQELAEVVVHGAKGKRAVLLANHGLIAMGVDLADALSIAMISEKTAQVTVGAMSLGQVQEISLEETKRLRKGYLQYLQSGKA